MLLIGAAACSASVNTRAPSLPAVPGAESGPALWVPHRVGSFHLAVYSPPETDSSSSLYRFVGPDSVLVDVTFSPGPDLHVECPVECAEAEARAMRDTWIQLWQNEGPGRTATPARLPDDQAAPWLVALGFDGSAPDSARFGWRVFYLPGLRIEAQGRYTSSPLRDLVVAEFLYYVMPAFSTPPVPLPPSTPDAVIQGFVGSWDFVGSPLLCGPGRHRISVEGSQLLIATPRANGSTDTTRYAIQRAGPGIISGETHVLRIQRVGERERGAFGELIAWDLVMDSADRFRWHRNDWYFDELSSAVLRCDRGPY